MKIFLLLNQPYPNGYALTKRFHLYAIGFISEGHYAKIIIPRPIEGNNTLLNNTNSGLFEKVPFVYSSNQSNRSRRFFARRYYDLLGSARVGLMCIKERPNIVITSSFSFYFFLYLKLISAFSSFKLISEKNEIDHMTQDKISAKQIKKLKFENSVFNGFIAINKHIINHIENDIGIKKPNIEVPILIEDFKKKKQPPIEKTIVYTGTYFERKDGILTIINAFAKISHEYPDYKLVLTGLPKRSRDYPKIVKEISNRGIESQVQFTGYLTEVDLQEALMSASILIIAKPKNRQNQYNFPTKVGEYLISGRPIIATKVGIIGEILEDNKNIFFAEYGIDNIADKMEFTLKNTALSNQIGKKGREFALANFNYLSYSKKMIEFFKILN